VALTSACATLGPPPDPQTAACERWFLQMDQAVRRHGTSDGGAARIEGFPGLRVDRFLAALAHPELSAGARAAWVERLRRLDLKERRLEWRNLTAGTSAELRPPIAGPPEPAIELCSDRLARRDLSPAARRLLLKRARVPDSYSTLARFLGLYGLTRWAVADGVYRLQRELRASFRVPPADPPVQGEPIRYGPPAGIGMADAAGLLRDSTGSPLAIPEPEPERLSLLFKAYAPVFAIDTASPADRPGSPRIGADGNAVVDIGRPAVYRLVSHGLLGNRPLLQLNYLLWFPARPPAGPWDIYAGAFDGLIWRVTLAPGGQPLAYDSIHPCGCYHQVFPGAGHRVVQPGDGSEPVLSPAPAPRLRPGERLVIRLAAATHYIVGLSSEAAGRANGATYALRDYDELRSLPAPDGRRRSLFDPAGLVPESARPERLLFWPMGIASAGAMRQWGQHAIAFLGRRHFDDPRLLERMLRPLGVAGR
jgi:hypothetical protein